MPFDKSIKKVLVIGSGPIIIGQAAEFDYAGAQACRVLKEAGVNVVLVNSNPATIMTDNALADEIYLEPLTAETVTRIIEKERPDSLLAGLGGQTGLTIAMQLNKEGALEKYGVRLIGTNIDAIDKAEDRHLFKETMKEIGEPTVPSDIANDIEHALAIASEIGYPVIIRPAFTLGGSGGGVAFNEEEMRAIAATGLDASPIKQILVEKYIFGWKEIEFETMRDSVGNVIAVCSMENVDPVGVHTGDSIVVAPALTLSDKEYQMLRSASLNIITALGIVGGCNCQFALNPDSFEYSVIEVNPRVSRSSALASKATGYPIAKITTKIALGYTLDEIANEITGKTYACFEPALDYVVVKFPKWPFDKFIGASRKLGTQMKATGEVMAIAPNFEMALMKAVRGAELSLDTLDAKPISSADITERLKVPDDRRIFSIYEAIKSGISVDQIFDITRIDRFFLNKIKNLVEYEESIGKGIDKALYMRGKKLGYTDNALRRISGNKKIPETSCVYKMVDTCGAEFDAATPYFYSTYDSDCESRALPRSGKPVILVLGSGPIRIGQGIEFDYSSVHCVWTLKELGYDVVIVNNNPETVSTDYDTADRLYFEPLTPEDVMNIIKVEKPVGVVVAFGGQTAIKLTGFLDRQGITILGTSAEGIDIAEDREKFDQLLEKFDIKRPRGLAVNTLPDALDAAIKLGFPVLLRPSYVIGGQNMRIVYNEREVTSYMNRILAQGIENPVLVDKYMMGSEIEVDVISDGDDVLIPGVMQHIERAGVHSGDSIAVYPPYNISDRMMKKVIESSEKLAKSLGTRGLVNIQFLIFQNELYVIEVNPRASRTVPYISKAAGLPMVDIATMVMTGQKLRDLPYGTGLYKTPPYFSVKVPVFSFEKLNDADSNLGPEMKSTGEVLGVGKNLQEALFKGMTSAGMLLRSGSANREIGVLISASSQDQLEIVSIAKKFSDMRFKIYATPETLKSISHLGIEVQLIVSIKDKMAYRLLEEGKISYVIYTGAIMDSTLDDYTAFHRRAMQLSIPCMTSLDTANAVADTIASRYTQQNTELVDINRMRRTREKLRFTKMHATGDDYIFIENFSGRITGPESLCVTLCDRHRGIGGDGIVLLEKSDVADIKMVIYNRDGSRGKMAGSSIRNVGKYIYDNGYVKRDTVTVETDSGVKTLNLYTSDGRVNEVSVNMGVPLFEPRKIPVSVLPEIKEIISMPATIGNRDYRITCLSLGNPHCVVFCEGFDNIDNIDIETVGPEFEYSKMFPERINTEFVKVVNPNMLKMRVWERGNGETPACGTGACAAVAAAVRNGFCGMNEDITVKVAGGDLIVNYTEEGIILSGSTVKVFEGEIEI